MNRNLDPLLRLARASAALLVYCAAIAALPAQTLQITSPAAGSVVYSGRTLTVTVNADSFAFQSVTVFTPDPEHTAVLSAPPYRLSFSLSPDTPSGRNRAISAMGVLRSGGAPVYSSISIDIERPDSPQQLILDLQAVSFDYVGEQVPLGVTGAFADGSRTGLEDSSYTTYSSDTPAVATVDGQGMVTAAAPGHANITITYATPSGGRMSAQVPVTVPQPIIVLPKSSSLYVSQSEELSVTLAIKPELNQSVTWSISPQLGSIDQVGHYAAPASVASRQKVTVTVRSVADPTKSASTEVWILPRRKNR